VASGVYSSVNSLSYIHLQPICEPSTNSDTRDYTDTDAQTDNAAYVRCNRISDADLDSDYHSNAGASTGISPAAND
jgi:hypothetical protein